MRVQLCGMAVSALEDVDLPIIDRLRRAGAKCGRGYTHIINVTTADAEALLAALDAASRRLRYSAKQAAKFEAQILRLSLKNHRENA